MDAIEIVYLSPAHPAPERDDVIWIPLERFASWKSPVHRELWVEVSRFLRKLNCDPT